MISMMSNNSSGKDIKIKVTSADIVARKTTNKPYYEIKYREIGGNEYHIGYGSYDLNREWFEIVEEDDVPLPNMERYQEDLDYIMQIQNLLISEGEWIIDTGNYQQVNAELLCRLKENIKKHPFLWKWFFMVA